MARTTRSTPAKSNARRKPVRDASGRSLTNYPRPSVAVDVAVLALLDGETPALGVLEVRRDEGGWTLPGVLLREHERLAAAASRALADKAGLRGPVSRQLRLLDNPERDDRGWVLSVAHVAVATAEQVAGQLTGRAGTIRLVAADAPGRLPHGLGEVVSAALDDLRARYALEPDPDGFLGDSFSLRELRLVHEAVAGYELQRDTFRRGMEPLLETTGQVVVGGRGRPAELFTRA